MGIQFNVGNAMKASIIGREIQAFTDPTSHKDTYITHDMNSEFEFKFEV